jgi:hypothetical protein
VRFRRNDSEEPEAHAVPAEAETSEPVAAPPDPDDPGAGWTPPAEPAGQSPLSASAASAEDDGFAERPEVFVGAAFVGGFAIAQLLKRFGE